MPDPKNSRDKHNIELQIKQMLAEKADKEELAKTGRIRNPRSLYHQKVAKDLKKKQTFISQDNRTKEIQEIDENKGKFEQSKKEALKRADVVTDVMQLGNFVPHPAFQTIGKAGNVLGSAIDGYQSYNDFSNGNYGSGSLNLASAMLPMFLGKSGYRRDMYNTNPSSLADNIASLGSRNGNYIPLTTLPHAITSSTIKGINYNKALLGTLGAETIYDTQYAMGGQLNNNNMPDPKKKQQKGKATRQDSLNVYNRSKEVENFYNNFKFKGKNEYIIKNRAIFDKNEAHGMNDLVIKERIENKIIDRDPYLNMNINKPYRKVIDNNRYYQRETLDQIINSKAPFQLFDRRIDPLKSTNYSGNHGDVANVYSYNNIGNKPFDLLTEKEKAQRVKQYGRSGVPDSYQSAKDAVKEDAKKFLPPAKKSQPSVVPVKRETQQLLNSINNEGIKNQEITASPIDLRPEARHAKYFNITDKVNMPLGGSESSYKYYLENGEPLKELAPEPYNTRKITPQYAYGGNLNNTMQNNQLTQFNEGGLHEENPNGGIPMGGNNTVEQGETKKKNYVYSNRLAIDENMTKQMYLPSYIKGKTFADASKAIDNKFKDRNDKPSVETKNSLLDRLKQAQETLKQQEEIKAQQIAQSIQSNSQQIPDMMNGEIPEGMEEFVQPKQMFAGGEIARTGPSALQMGSITSGLDVGTKLAMSDESGAMNSAIEGGFGLAGTAIGGPIGGMISGQVGKLATGLIGGISAGKEADRQRRKDALNQTNAFTNDFAKGGYLTKKSSKYVYGGPLPKPPTADMETNIIKNLHNALGIQPNVPGYGTAWGNKSNQALFDYDIKNKDADALAAKEKGAISWGNSKEDMLANNYPLMNKQMGLTKQGYKYLDPETPDTSGLVKPFVEPTGVLDKMEANYQSSPNKINPSSDVSSDSDRSWLDKNGGKILKYAPVAMNAYQLSKLGKPQNKTLNRIDQRFNPEYVDERSLQNIAGNEMTNTINSISQSGVSTGQGIASMLGAGLNKAKALSSAYIDAKSKNIDTGIQGQQFNAGINQFNAQTQHQESQNWEQNDANYRNERSKYLSSIGSDLGSIGKEEINKNRIADALGYDTDGDYVINRVTKERIHKDELAARIAAKEKATATTENTYGGYLKMKKIGRK